MTANLTFFPVDNGDMALITLDNGQNIVVDINIRGAADDPDDDEVYDVGKDLKDRLKKDDQGRPYVDVFVLSHPDADHVTGLRTHFHLGPPGDYPKDSNKIIIREMWSSPIVFRRASKNHKLCDDALAWATEARRRVKLYKDAGSFGTGPGDRILVLGEDKDGKTDDIQGIVIKQDGMIYAADRVIAGAFEARLLAPGYVDSADQELIETLERNNSSVILRFSIAADGYSDKCRFLTGGDADVSIWELLWQKNGENNPDWFSFDVAETPHHCSWRTLSHDRWSIYGEDAKVSEDARKALSQTREGAVIVASCKPIKKDDDNPPHERAKREYVSIVDGDEDRFICTSEYTNANDRPLELTIASTGISKKQMLGAVKAAAIAGITTVTTTARAHG